MGIPHLQPQVQGSTGAGKDGLKYTHRYSVLIATYMHKFELKNVQFRVSDGVKKKKKKTLNVCTIACIHICSEGIEREKK